MTSPSDQELNDSIQELTAYRDRLQKEVKSIATKLRMPQNKVQSALIENAELKQIEAFISQLIKQRDGKGSIDVS